MIHDELKNQNKKLKVFKNHVYILLDSFTLDASIWWNNYFAQLEKEILILEIKSSVELNVSNLFRQELSEIA